MRRGPPLDRGAVSVLAPLVGLDLFGVGERPDQGADLLAEAGADLADLHLALLDHVVQQRRRQYLFGEAVRGEQFGDRHRVVDVGHSAAAVADLSGVGLARGFERTADQLRAIRDGLDPRGRRHLKGA